VVLLMTVREALVMQALADLVIQVQAERDFSVPAFVGRKRPRPTAWSA
jgi:hypothetical protein